jgi:two-component system, NtrC family, response regulator HydG
MMPLLPCPVMTQVLILEPDPKMRAHVRTVLEGSGYAVSEPGELGLEPRALESMDLSGYACVIASRQPCEGQPFDVLDLCRTTAVILVTHGGEVRDAVRAIKRGASDYLAAPFEPDELVAAVEQCIAERHRRDQGGRRGGSRAGDFPMIGDSAAMRALYARIDKVAPTDLTVLIRGESGTGKELVARALHAASQRARAPMISLNCATIPPNLIETELFGYAPPDAGSEAVRAGLLEAADGGTLFLDEIGELPLEAQARLLRVLHSGELRRFGSAETLSVNVRLITATHRDLDRLIAQRQFRQDLYYRLNVVSLEVPPLREREEDVQKLADFILARTRERLGKPEMYLSAATRSALRAYDWPGNVRELQNAIERAVILCDGRAIEPDLLAIDVARARVAEATAAVPEQSSLEDYFVSFVLAHQDNLTETELAEKLGISRKSLWERRQRLNIPRRRTRQRGPRREHS